MSLRKLLRRSPPPPSPSPPPAPWRSSPTYAPLNPPQPTEGGGKIEVIEFFWYGCPHCYAPRAGRRRRG